MNNFVKLASPFLPQWMINSGKFIGGKFFYKLHSGRVFCMYFDNAPHGVAIMGRGDAVWLKVINPAGIAPEDIRVDVTAIPFKSVPALAGKSVNTQDCTWQYCAAPSRDSLADVRRQINDYISVFE